MTDYELVWVLSGSATWTVQSEQTHTNVLVPGSLALARAQTVDRYDWDPSRESSHAFVHFEIIRPDGGGQWNDDEEHWPLVRSMLGGSPLAGLTQYLLAIAGSEHPLARERSDEILGLVVDLFVRGPFGVTAHEITSAHVLRALQHVRSVWRAEGTRILALEDLADAAGVTSGHLSREFREEFGRGSGFVSALELIRLGTAAVALQRTNLSLDEIASDAGFTNPYHFSHRFSLAYEIAPGRFRRAAGEAIDPLEPLERRGLMAAWHVVAGTV